MCRAVASWSPPRASHGEAELQHQLQGLGVAGLGGPDQARGLLGGGQVPGQPGIGGQLLPHGSGVGVLEGGQEPVGRGGVVGGAVAPQFLG